MTEKFQALKARLEGTDPSSALIEKESYQIFVDAYFKVEQDFDMKPKEMFDLLNSTEALNTLFSKRMTFAPAHASSHGRMETGDVYLATADNGISAPVVYDAFAVQVDGPRQIRIVLDSPDVIMEWDVLVLPTLTGSRVIIIMIINYTETLAGQSFDVVMQTSELDQWAEEGLAALKEKYEDPR